MDYKRNNLDKALSPYLKQHMENPVWWQEWNKETIEYAKRKNKPLFVSAGYSSCHWCHVMASEAFSDNETAEYLNKNFVSVKVDKEERPDIDRFLMSVAVSSTGSGGWPLNIFLFPDLAPIAAMTYVPAKPSGGMPSFLEIIRRIKIFYDENVGLGGFTMPVHERRNVTENEMAGRLIAGFDPEYGGIGTGTKFPMHSQLLFMLYYLAETENIDLSEVLRLTMDRMYSGGLHDHLQGGFFRYCVDREWTIPHFEKMLYDQAYLLWTYSTGYRLFGLERYLSCALKIVQCLEETFEDDGLFFSAHDADTAHEEGATYLWSDGELRAVLTEREYKMFAEVFDVSKAGNFKGKNHLIKKKEIALDGIEGKLLMIRKARVQPFTDRKIITSFNCISGAGMVHSYRYTGTERYLEKAEKIFKKLLDIHYKDGRLYHSSIDGKLMSGEFLEDYAAMLLLAGYLYEETGMFKEYVNSFYGSTMKFNENGRWIESDNDDFMKIPAENSDYSVPSSASLAGLAVTRGDILLEKEYGFADFSDPMNTAFLNISALIKKGLFYVIRSKEKPDWKKAPLNSIWVKSKEFSVCYKGTCRDKMPEKQD